MHKKLVMLDPESRRFTEIDQVKLKRVAAILYDWLLEIDPNNDPFKFLTRDLPLVKAALDGTLKLPYKEIEPHILEFREGLLPLDYIEISSPFYNTIRGQHMVPPEIVECDGKSFALMNFEDPGDER